MRSSQPGRALHTLRWRRKEAAGQLKTPRSLSVSRDQRPGDHQAARRRSAPPEPPPRPPATAARAASRPSSSTRNSTTIIQGLPGCLAPPNDTTTLTSPQVHESCRGHPNTCGKLYLASQGLRRANAQRGWSTAPHAHEIVASVPHSTRHVGPPLPPPTRASLTAASPARAASYSPSLPKQPKQGGRGGGGGKRSTLLANDD